MAKKVAPDATVVKRIAEARLAYANGVEAEDSAANMRDYVGKLAGIHSDLVCGLIVHDEMVYAATFLAIKAAVAEVIMDALPLVRIVDDSRMKWEIGVIGSTE